MIEDFEKDARKAAVEINDWAEERNPADESAQGVDDDSFVQGAHWALDYVADLIARIRKANQSVEPIGATQIAMAAYADQELGAIERLLREDH